MPGPLAFLLLAAIHLSPEIPIASPTPAPQYGARPPDAVATDGTDFLIAWPNTDGLNVAVFDANGAMSGAPRLMPRPSAISGVSVCWTGAVYLATWTESSLGVVAATLSRDGTVVSLPQVVAASARTGKDT